MEVKIVLNINNSKEVRENQLFDSALIKILALKNAVIAGSPILITPNEESPNGVHSIRIDLENIINEEQFNIINMELSIKFVGFL